MVFWALAAVGVVYLLLPILIMFPLSLEAGPLLRFPPERVSFHWYQDYLRSEDWLAATALSIKVGVGAACFATILGTLAALGLARMPNLLGDLSRLALLSPLVLPTVVVAISIYGVYISLRLVGATAGLILAHTVFTLPFVVLNVSASMAAAPRALQEAAMSLGAAPLATFLQVTVPLLSRGIISGAVFSFLVSFDEVVIAKFLSGAETPTLPKRMLDGVFYEMTPMLAAISCTLVLTNVLVAAAALAFSRSHAPIRAR
jgi:putative spermidine/putrescine transport system permease protein